MPQAMLLLEFQFKFRRLSGRVNLKDRVRPRVDDQQTVATLR